MNQIVTNDWIKVYGKNDDILAAGKVVFTKDSKSYHTDGHVKEITNFVGFSFDDKFFFNEKSLNKTIFVKSNEEHLEKPFDSEHIPEYLSWKIYREATGNVEEDILRDFGIDELDEEVVYLVKVLNQFEDIKTTGSCCGHNKLPLFVDIIFNDHKTLFKILWLISKAKYNEKICLTTVPDIKNCNIHNGMMRLCTKLIGKEAYKIANDFAKDLEIIGRN